MNRLPPDAFEVYVSLGPGRSYSAVAKHYGVTKRSVTKRAAREGWQHRLEAIEAEARKKTNERLVDVVDEMNQRHLKTAKAIQGKALEALRSMALDSAMSAVRALDLGMKQERLIHGEPSERTAHSIEEVVRREYERWMLPADAGEDDDAEAE